MFYSDVEGVVCTSGTSTDVYLEQVGDNVQKQPLPAAIIRLPPPAFLDLSISKEFLHQGGGGRESPLYYGPKGCYKGHVSHG